MKIVNEKGKLFGIINVVDLICLIIALLLALGVGWKILGPKVQESVAPTTTMTTTFRIRGTYDYMLRELERIDLVGQRLLMGTGYVDATVTSVNYEPYTVQLPTDDGRIVDAVDPIRKDVIITVESEVASGTPILKIGTQEVRAGRTFTFKTRTFETNAIIDSVAVND